MNTAPSRQYVVLPPTVQPTVVSSPCVERTGADPVLSSRKQPVPYVFFAAPSSKPAWPNKAAC